MIECKVRGMYLGSARKLDAEVARQKARKTKAEALGNIWSVDPSIMRALTLARVHVRACRLGCQEAGRAWCRGGACLQEGRRFEVDFGKRWAILYYW